MLIRESRSFFSQSLSCMCKGDGAVLYVASVHADGDSRKKHGNYRAKCRGPIFSWQWSKTWSLWEGRWQFSCRQWSFVLLPSCHVLMISFQSNISHPESFRWEEFLEGFRKVKSVRHGFHLECISYKDLLVRVPLHNVPWKAGPASHFQCDVYMRRDRWNTIGDNQVCYKNSRCPEFSWWLF